MSKTGGGGLARVTSLRVCKHPLYLGVAHAGRRKGELTSCRGTVLSAWQKPLVRRTEETGLPARVSGRHVVRGTDRPYLSLPNIQPCFGGSKGSRQGNRQGW